MIETQRRHLANPEEVACQPPTVPRDNLAVAIDQDRDIKAEGPDAISDLPDLLFGMAPWVGGIRFQLLNPAINDTHPSSHGCAEIRGIAGFHLK